MNKQAKRNKKRTGLPGGKVPPSNQGKGSKPGHGEYGRNRIGHLPEAIRRAFY